MPSEELEARNARAEERRAVQDERDRELAHAKAMLDLRVQEAALRVDADQAPPLPPLPQPPRPPTYVDVLWCSLASPLPGAWSSRRGTRTSRRS
jgi:hypothetical protein